MHNFEGFELHRTIVIAVYATRVDFMAISFEKFHSSLTEYFFLRPIKEKVHNLIF